MTSFGLIMAVFAGILVLLVLILYFKIHAFISLLIASIVTGLLAGLDAGQMIDTIQQGMGSTLGFVATVVGLGAIFGAILEKSGGALTISNALLKKFGTKNAPIAMLLSGFVIAVPVFFDVAFIILIPIVNSLQRKTKKSLLLYAIPLLAGLAITHTFIPPTPGPVAVANIIDVDLGSVIIIGFLVGIPTAMISGLWFGKYIGQKIHIEAPELTQTEEQKTALPSAAMVFLIISVPILLIVLNTAVKSGMFAISNEWISQTFVLIGHPFVALIIANLLAWYFLGIKRSYSRTDLMKISSKSFEPAGTIILLTGAGGVFKQVLVNTEIGEVLASSMDAWGIPIILFAFLAAALVRLLQGSATVAMITAAGLVSPLLGSVDMSNLDLACIVIAIASGASILSHVNDSGFWLVGQYLGMDEKRTFRSWSMMTLILAVSGFCFVYLISLLV